IESGQRNIVIDLSGVDFIASCGYGLLLSMASELRENNNGDITLLAVPDPTLEMLVTMGVDDFFRMIDSVDEISRIGDPA
ncbi:MAG: STAS domain-containing protein, partial [bacterium]|nr:STAS domain-containing protein [bacterium]